MEKYRSTADPSTGIHPYLPQPTPPTSLLNKLLRPILLFLRLPLFLLALLLPIILTPLLLIPSFLSRGLTRLLARLLLFSLGATRFAPPSLPKSRMRVRGKPVAFRPPSAGDLVVTNLNGAVGVLQSVVAYSPIFLVPVEHGIAQLSLNQLASFVASGKPPSNLPLINAEATLATARTPVVLLAEGGFSNGRGVLRFSPRGLSLVFDYARKSNERRIFALGLAPRRGQEYCGIGKPFTRYVLQLMSEVATDVIATYVEVPHKDVSTVHAAVAKCAGIPPLAVAADGREEFDRHWKETGGMNR